MCVEHIRAGEGRIYVEGPQEEIPRRQVVQKEIQVRFNIGHTVTTGL